MAFGFASRQMSAPASQPDPWSGLPTGAAPWGGSPTWQAARQAPWRMSPWQTQAMPSAAPVAPPPTPAPAPSPYLGQGVSGDIPGFQSGVPGGGFYPQQAVPVPAPAPAPAPSSPIYQGPGGVLSTANPFDMRDMSASARATQQADLARQLQQDPYRAAWVQDTWAKTGFDPFGPIPFA